MHQQEAPKVHTPPIEQQDIAVERIPNNEPIQPRDERQAIPVQPAPEEEQGDHVTIPMEMAAPPIQVRQEEQQPILPPYVPIDDHIRRIDRLEEVVHHVPPFSCRDAAEVAVPLGFLGGSIMFIINDCTNKDGINGKSLAGNIMTALASISGLGVVLHNWWDRYRRQNQATRQVRPNDPLDNA